MDIKKLLIGSTAGAIVFFLLGWLFYDKLLVDFLRKNPGEIGLVGRQEIKFVFLIAGQFFHAVLLTFILLRSNLNSSGGGLLAGAIVGFLMSAAIDFTIYGTSVILSKKGLMADVMAATVISSVAGAVIGMVTGRKK